MRRLAALLALSACQAQAQPTTPAPACADGQQNPCKCEGIIEGTQVCSSGAYSACDCSPMTSMLENRQREKVRTQAVQLQQLAEQFQLQKRRCPSDLIEMFEAGFTSSTPSDAWGGAFDLKCDSSERFGKIEITSPGPDRKLGTDDDISSQSM